jgi:hypothetical protein
MKANVGIADSGMASAEMTVARTCAGKTTPPPRRVSILRSARSAPNDRCAACARPWCKWVICTAGFSADLVEFDLNQFGHRATSEAPLALNTPKVVAGRPLSRAMLRNSCDAVVHVRRLRAAHRLAARSDDLGVAQRCRRLAPPSTRMACSPPPTCARPPAASRLSARSWSLTSTAVRPSACSRLGSSSTRISRSTPPLRDTCATPLTAAAAWSRCCR